MALDIEEFNSLRDYLTERGHIAPGEVLAFRKLAGGVSNRTVRAAWPDGRAWVLKQALAKLRVNVDWFSSPERIGVEAKALRWLNRSAPPGTTPAFIFEDAANFLMGMDAIPDDHENWKSVLLAGRIVSDHFEQFGVLLGTVHRESSAGSTDARTAFADTTYFENLRLEPYYLYAAQKVASAAEFLRSLARETLLHKDSLVHGDFSPKNTLIYRDKLILLDYEVVHFGDPAFDVGFALTHFLSKAHHLPDARIRLAGAAELFWHTYHREIEALDWAATLEERAVRHTLGCLLARVAGKSPLEYLTLREMARQREVTLALIANPPLRVPELIDAFVRKIGIHEIGVYAKN
jgi:5-methylthioribose kinase